MPTPTQNFIEDKDGTTYSFIDLRNPVHLKGQVIENVSRPGVDGDAWRKTGKRGEQFEMVGERDFASFDDSDTFQSSLNDLRGTIITVTDCFATEYTCLVLNVFRETQRPVLAHVGGVSGASVGAAVALATFRFSLWHQPPDA